MAPMQFHDIANIFPLIEGEEFNQLVADIRTHGVREPIWVFEGKILDGRNRYRAALEAGAEVQRKEFAGTVLDAIDLVWSLNWARRHLSSSQAAIADAKRNKLTDAYAPVRQAAKERQGERTDLKPNIVEQIPQSVPAPKTRDIRAKVAGTNAKYIDFADKLVEERPDLVAEIESGKKTITQVQREIKRQELSARTPSPPTGKYRVIYADPPWSYNDKCDAGSVQSGGAEKHYPSMTLNELCNLAVPPICEPDSVLFLWATSPLLPDALAVASAWGFKYKAAFVWDKVRHNMGHYNSVRHELLLVCTKGSCTPDVQKLFDSVQSIEKTDRHSQKPEEFRQIIDTLYTRGDRIELFRRGNAPAGWAVWGNEADDAAA